MGPARQTARAVERPHRTPQSESVIGNVPAGGSCGTLLCHAGTRSHGGVTQTKWPPENPRAVHIWYWVVATGGKPFRASAWLSSLGAAQLDEQKYRRIIG